MKEMIGVLCEKNGKITRIEINAIGSWFIVRLISKSGRSYNAKYKNIANEDCGDFFIRTFARTNKEEYNKYLRCLRYKNKKVVA